MTALRVVGPLSADEARTLTDEAKSDAAALWAKLLRLYEGGAHLALGYSSWNAYYEAEFGGSASRGSQLIAAAHVAAMIQAENTTGIPESSLPRTERVARELAPLRSDPPLLREAWRETIERHGTDPSASQVREIVQGRACSTSADEPCYLNDVREFLARKYTRDMTPRDRGHLRQVLLDAADRLEKEGIE